MTIDAYVTMQGDAWDAIAYRLWGDEFLFMALVNANPEYADHLTFPAGVLLRVPPKPDAPADRGLPPWM